MEVYRSSFIMIYATLALWVFTYALLDDRSWILGLGYLLLLLSSFSYAPLSFSWGWPLAALGCFACLAYAIKYSLRRPQAPPTSMLHAILILDQAIVDGHATLYLSGQRWFIQGADAPQGTWVKVIAVMEHILSVEPVSWDT